MAKRKVRLEVPELAVGAVRIYEAFGFARVGEYACDKGKWKMLRMELAARKGADD